MNLYVDIYVIFILSHFIFPGQAYQGPCIPQPELHAQIHADLSIWRPHGISEELLQASLKQAYSSQPSGKFTAAGILIQNNQVYLSTGALHPDTNDFFYGILHDIQDAASAVGLPDTEFVVHCGDNARSTRGQHFDLPEKKFDGSAVQVPLPIFGYCKRSQDFEILIPSGHFWQHRYEDLLSDSPTSLPHRSHNLRRRYPAASTASRRFSPASAVRGGVGERENGAQSSPGMINRAFGRFTAASEPMGILDAWGKQMPPNPREHLMGLSRAANETATTLGSPEAREWTMDVWTLNDFSTNKDIPGVTRVPFKDHGRYKMLVSIDGYTCSTRLEKLLAINGRSVVLKQKSIFYSFYYQALRPYVHYVPFWESDPDDILSTIQWVKNHSAEVEEIARNGQDFANRYLSNKSRMCYWKVLLQEYSKLLTYTPSLANRPTSISLNDEPLMQKPPFSPNGRT